MSKGIDVSKHNGVIDWRKVKADGIDFAIIRAGYARVVDNKFRTTSRAHRRRAFPWAYIGSVTH